MDFLIRDMTDRHATREQDVVKYLQSIDDNPLIEDGEHRTHDSTDYPIIDVDFSSKALCCHYPAPLHTPSAKLTSNYDDHVRQLF